MKFFKLSQVTQLDGIVGMSEKQAKRRLPRMRPVKGRKDVYELPQPLDFKAGEIVGLDVLPKALLRVIEGSAQGGDPIEFDPKTGEAKEQKKAPAADPKAGESGDKKDASKTGAQDSPK